MPKKIVFLDDGSVTGKRLKRGIQAAGYSYVDVTTDATLRDQVLLGGAIAVLHVPTQAHRFHSLWTRFAQDFPKTPVIHIIEEADFMPQDWLKSPFHEWLDITTTVQSLVRRIDTLVHFESLEARLTESQRQASRVDAFTRAVSSIEAPIVVRSALDIMQTEFAASQVLWFPETCLADEAERYFQIQAIPVAERKPARMLWSASGEVSRELVDRLFDAWTASDGQAWTKSPHPREINNTDFIIPVLGPADVEGTQKTLGHLVFVEPRNVAEMRNGPVLPAYLERFGIQLKDAFAYGLLKSLTYKDDLTDLYNQRYLPTVLEQELNRASRTAREFSVLFCDVDFFKLVNDTKGHMVGSKVLIELSKIFHNSIRASDFAFRYGGDEYVIVLSGANSQNAAMVAERLRKKAADATFDVNGSNVKITVSIGIATFPEHAKSADQILQMADEAMYYGKHKSRNVVHIAS